jgi:molybdate transport system ATP-binding protein
VDSTSDKPLLSVRISCRLSSAFTLETELEASTGFTMLLGPSGCGKSTLLNCIAGFVRPSSGKISLNKHLLFDATAGVDVAVPYRRLGYVFQNLALFPHMTVEQNIRYGLVMMAMLKSFHIGHLIGRKPGQISGGERQRVALARSLVTRPELLLLDEPLSALDTRSKAEILDDLREWNAIHRIPILYVTHSPAEAFAVGDKVAVLRSGKILAQGTPQEVLAAPRHETIAQLVGFENAFDATVRSIDEAQGTMVCQLSDTSTTLEVPLGNTDVGAPVRIAIRAGDIMLSTEQPRGFSARNSLFGKIIAIRREGLTIIVTVEAGASFQVHLTPASVEELDLRMGREVWAVIKTYSCNLVQPSLAGSPAEDTTP